jgi:hypothetical protein
MDDEVRGTPLDAIVGAEVFANHQQSTPASKSRARQKRVRADEDRGRKDGWAQAGVDVECAWVVVGSASEFVRSDFRRSTVVERWGRGWHCAPSLAQVSRSRNLTQSRPGQSKWARVGQTRKDESRKSRGPNTRAWALAKALGTEERPVDECTPRETEPGTSQ